MRRVLAVVTLAGGLAIAGLQDTRLTASVSKGSTQGYRAADHNPFGVNNEYGMVNLSIEQTTTALGVGQDAHRRVREAGVGWVRYWLSWEVVQPTNDPNPANWNWTASDYDIDAAIDQGLNVYVSIVGRAGVAARRRADLPLAAVLRRQRSRGIRPSLAAARPGSANAYAPFDPAPGEGQSANWKRFVHAAVKRYGDRVKYWGFWNEPTERHFWPEWPEGNCQDRLGQLVTKVIKPGREAALAANPSVQIVGPDDYLPDSIEHLLHLERDGGCGVPPAGRLFDVIALHSYNIPSGGGVLNTIQATLNDHFRREVWLTETNGGAGLQNALAPLRAARLDQQGVRRIDAQPGHLRRHQPARRQQAAVSVLHHAEGLHHRASAGDARRRHDRHRRPQRLRPADEPARARHVGDRALLHRGGRRRGRGPTRCRRRAGPRCTSPSEGWGGVEQGVSVVPARTDLPIWIEHADYWNNNKAGRLSQGTGERSDTWYFAEGVVGGTYWIHDNTAYNPSATDRVRVTWQFMNASGTLAEVTHEIAPRGSHRVRVNDVPGIEGEHATLVRGVWADDGLPAPIVAERTITLGQRHRGPLDPRRAVPVADVGTSPRAARADRGRRSCC